MGALGPVLGGWLIDTVGWQAIFFIYLPLASGAVVLAGRFVPKRSSVMTKNQSQLNYTENDSPIQSGRSRSAYSHLIYPAPSFQWAQPQSR